MPTKLADTRDLDITLDAACEIFRQIAGCETRIERTRAMHEARITKLKDQCTLAIASDLCMRDKLEAQLSGFILRNPELFQTPRAVVTDFGKFGLRSVSNVAIEDEDKLLEYARNCDLDDLYEERTTIQKKAVTKRLRDGQAVPGATITVGERAFYTVAKALLEEARNVKAPPA